MIDGYRDTYETACPGNLLYAQPQIRRRARPLMDDAAKTMLKVRESGTVSDAPGVGHPHGVPGPGVHIRRDGQAIPNASRTYLVSGSDFRTKLVVQINAAADGCLWSTRSSL